MRSGARVADGSASGEGEGEASGDERGPRALRAPAPHAAASAASAATAAVLVSAARYLTNTLQETTFHFSLILVQSFLLYFVIHAAVTIAVAAHFACPYQFTYLSSILARYFLLYPHTRNQSNVSFLLCLRY